MKLLLLKSGRRTSENLENTKTTGNSELELRGSDCLVSMDCLLNVVRALGMGSCLTWDGNTTTTTSLTNSGESTSSGGAVKKKTAVRRVRRNSSFESKRDEWLRRIPGRLYSNGANDVASLFTKQGKKGINQDAMIVWENFGSKVGTVFCGVFDGHGPYGHMVAKRVRDTLPLKLCAQWALISDSSKDGISDISSSATGSMNSGDIAFTSLDEESKNSVDHEYEDKNPDIFQTLKESFLKAFKVMDKELKLHPYVDCYFSGTTAVTLIKQGQDLVIGNVGDSRAVLGTRDEDDFLVAVQLTVDLKPNLPREAERIRRCKGRVYALQNEPEVFRVWLPNNDFPGLAMARAFGDFCLKGFGVISVPEIFYRRLTEKDEFVVLATDGVWDVLSNKEVVNIVASAPQSCAARAVVESAVRVWKFKYPTSKVDDCAVVCLFLNSNSNNSCTSYSIPEE